MSDSENLATPIKPKRSHRANPNKGKPLAKNNRPIFKSKRLPAKIGDIEVLKIASQLHLLDMHKETQRGTH